MVGQWTLYHIYGEPDAGLRAFEPGHEPLGRNFS
jgi:hypothetical protein